MIGAIFRELFGDQTPDGFVPRSTKVYRFAERAGLGLSLFLVLGVAVWCVLHGQDIPAGLRDVFGLVLLAQTGHHANTEYQYRQMKSAYTAAPGFNPAASGSTPFAPVPVQPGGLPPR